MNNQLKPRRYDHVGAWFLWKMVLCAIAEFRNPTQDEDYP